MVKLENYDKKNDIELVKLAISSDQRAYSNLLSRYYNFILSILLKSTQNRTLSEDLTIEVFTKVFRKLHTFNSKYSFKNWITTIAKKHYIDYLRKNKIDNLPLDKVKTDNGNNPEDIFIKKEDAERLNFIINKLEERYKKVLHYRYTDGENYETIAKKMQIPIGTVKTLLYRAKALLHSSMQHF